MIMQPTSSSSGQRSPTPVKAQGPIDAPDVNLNGIDFRKHHERIIEELKLLGASRYGQTMMEARYLPKIIHPDEHIEGVVYGWQEVGVVMMVATDRRVLFVDKKPLYVRDDEISYASVRGVSRTHKLLMTSVTLHTQVDDFVVNTLNGKCVNYFMKSIERHSLEFNQAR